MKPPVFKQAVFYTTLLIASSGNVTDEIINEYEELQDENPSAQIGAIFVGKQTY